MIGGLLIKAVAFGEVEVNEAAPVGGSAWLAPASLRPLAEWLDAAAAAVLRLTPGRCDPKPFFEEKDELAEIRRLAREVAHASPGTPTSDTSQYGDALVDSILQNRQ